VRVDVVNPVGCGVELRSSDVFRSVDYLSLEIGDIHGIEVDEAKRADSGRGKIERRRRTEPARTDQENAGLLELSLSRCSDFVENEMPTIASQLVVSQLGKRMRVWIRHLTSS
jgi:hypothetical protein